MNKDYNGFELKHITKEDIKNGSITLNAVEGEEKKLVMIQDEFRAGMDIVKDLPPSVTFYGSARLKEDHPEYIKAYKLAFRVAKELGYIIITGGGPGIMEAANKGAREAGVESIGLTIRLPHEQDTNKYVTREASFHFFFARQVCMSYTTEACVFCAGGFGTLNELFEVLTIQQTGKVGKFPIVLYGVEFWTPLKEIMKEFLHDKYELIGGEDTEIFTITDDEDEILEIIKNSRIRQGEDALY